MWLFSVQITLKFIINHALNFKYLSWCLKVKAKNTHDNDQCKKGKGKGKVSPLQAWLWPRGWMEVQLYSFMTATLEGSAAHPGRTLPLGKARYPLYRRLVGPQGWSGQAENLAPPGFDPQTTQHVASHYTDWATRPIHDQCTVVNS